MNWCQEKRWKNGTLPSWNEMLRIPVPVTFNPGWGWTTLEGLILRRQSGVREPEASGTPGTSQPSITRPARLHITGVSGACDHSSASNARTRKEAGARNYHWPLCLLLPFCVRLAVVTLPDEASPIFLDAPTSNQWCLWVLCPLQSCKSSFVSALIQFESSVQPTWFLQTTAKRVLEVCPLHSARKGRLTVYLKWVLFN